MPSGRADVSFPVFFLVSLVIPLVRIFPVFLVLFILFLGIGILVLGSGALRTPVPVCWVGLPATSGGRATVSLVGRAAFIPVLSTGAPTFLGHVGR